VLEAATDIVQASGDLLRRKLTAGILLDQADHDQSNKTSQHMRIDPILA
jgi:hypothetical protein